MLRQAALAACSCKQRLDTLNKSGFAHWLRVALHIVLSTNRPKWVMKLGRAAEIAEQFLQRSLLCFEGKGLISCTLPHPFSSRYWRHEHSRSHRCHTIWNCHCFFCFFSVKIPRCMKCTTSARPLLSGKRTSLSGWERSHICSFLISVPLTKVLCHFYENQLFTLYLFGFLGSCVFYALHHFKSLASVRLTFFLKGPICSPRLKNTLIIVIGEKYNWKKENTCFLFLI